jgi:pimeloyl-ACP methyl ester carboxylesterase
VTAAPDLHTITISGAAIEYRRVAAADPALPVLVFLHEGLGCTALWRDFPDQLCEATGCGGLIYSRQGYGGSDPCELPRPLDYMERAAIMNLPEILRRFGIENFCLVGHSDGASIALIHAGQEAEPDPKAVIVMAPHVFCEEISVAGISAARDAYETGDLKEKLKKFHGMNTECAFRGWNDAWLDPAFGQWNIERYLLTLTAPILAIQGRDDSYGTLAQLDAIAAGTAGSFDKLVLDNCGHNPWQEQRDKVLAATTEFILAHAG